MKHVVFNGNDNYAPHIATSLVSLLRYNRNLHIHIVANGITAESEQKIRTLFIGRSDCILEFHQINDQQIKALIKLRTKDQVDFTFFGPLLLTEILSDKIKKVVALDADTIVCANIDELFEIKVELVGGVIDTLEKFHRQAVGMTDEDHYINTGCLVINLANWRRDNVLQQMVDYVIAQKGNVPHLDQQVVNAVLKEKLTVLPPKWNVLTPMFLFSSKKITSFYELKHYYSDTELVEAIQQPRIIHYTPGIVGRPWMKNCQHPRTTDYLQARQKSGFPLVQAEDDRTKNARRLEQIYQTFGEWGYFTTLRVINLLKPERTYSS